MNHITMINVDYYGLPSEFICYKSFHSTIELTVRNRLMENNLLYPILSVAEIEIFCLPQFSIMDMGVGTRKNTNTEGITVSRIFWVLAHLTAYCKICI